ncbi:MAG: hypothetical protein QXG65_05265 [Thermoplasmata archaeon]
MTPSTTSSDGPPVRGAMTAAPEAIASSSATLAVSLVEARTKRSEADRSAGFSSSGTGPRNRTRSLSEGSEASRARTAASSGPRPPTTATNLGTAGSAATASRKRWIPLSTVSRPRYVTVAPPSPTRPVRRAGGRGPRYGARSIPFGTTAIGGSNGFRAPAARRFAAARVGAVARSQRQ